jgi:hypothetical protein
LAKENEKLDKDLKIMEVMVANMGDYLDSSILFWPTLYADLPKVTLGGYLVREQRLQALKNLLDEAENKQLAQTVKQFANIAAEKGFQLKEKAQRELEARVRQWQEYLRDLEEEDRPSLSYYQTSAETRAMITALREKLQSLGVSLPADLVQQVEASDNTLRHRWQAGAFVWPNEWQPAYPQDAYWWLYGQPV